MRCTNIAKLFPNAVNSRQAQGVTVDTVLAGHGLGAGPAQAEQRAEQCGDNAMSSHCYLHVVCKYVGMLEMLGQRG